ncbi:sarcosine oxidase alpha subunit family protein [Novosphingobium nitrogenifigens DSM 19370]|uniref:Sarcosine oxidase alpha subunit family protein n=1 Tax=Novosphingobium nitrogenifigens DSM 19370 TaxID=983920 RepID=F1ZAF3_9SPHN|nr:2Fe-2S iron-sulfur cluster-binding protein [Novosphingobium nitrogenifigens]EGD58439.1 sarcosine oxidase alpha subunit family protein [Novosphingobium nitrogenifigens DSM 19370]
MRHGSGVRAGKVPFTFNGQAYWGQEGDTLAAALLANGVKVVARSFKYHRPRGIMAAGVEEPCALVTVGDGGRREPNTRATDVFLYPGLVATSQNAWPSLSFDIGAINGRLSGLIPAGFYYKTFFGPPSRWMLYERVIRRAAGLGKAPVEPDPDGYCHRAAFADVLIVGAGPAGLAAACVAAESGARVILLEQDALPGGSLLAHAVSIDGVPGAEWARGMVDRIRAAGGRVLFRTTATGYWDDNFITAVERLAEPGQVPSGPVQCLWKLRCERVILATGALERPLVFAGNDLPGVMLASAAQTYAARYGVAPGQRAVVATSHDAGYRAAFALADVGVAIVAVLDTRSDPVGPLVHAARSRFPVHTDARVLSARGRKGVLVGLEAAIGGGRQTFAADLLAMSGGMSPVLHLHRQAGGALVHDPVRDAYLPGEGRQNHVCVGAATGEGDLATILSDALCRVPVEDPLGAAGAAWPGPVWRQEARGKAFVDFQHDVTTADLALAQREGFVSSEHVKRYTTLGMGTDQGKTGAMVALAQMADLRGVALPEAGLTTFRPPYTPVTMAAFAGTMRGDHAGPIRRLPLAAMHEALGAQWVPAGVWMRPRAYPAPGETIGEASVREARMVRNRVGIVDVSSLAKFEIAGPDALALVLAVCATPVSKLAVGRGRYTVMLREDGMVMDDGTVWRVAHDRWLVTSSTGGAARMARHWTYVRDVLLDGARAAVVDVGERWAGIALAGPSACRVLTGLINAAAPAHMGLVDATIAGVPVRVLAASYSGERAFEIHVAAHRVGPVWQALHAAVVEAGGGVYGLDAMDHLRVEKGHVVIGAEADGRTTPADLGMGGMLRKAGGFVGWQGLMRPALSETAGRRHLVGITALDDEPLPEGAMLVMQIGEEPQGHVTTAAPRIAAGEGAWIGLALLTDGVARHGEIMVAWSPVRDKAVRVWVGPPMFHDPEGVRYRD